MNKFHNTLSREPRAGFSLIELLIVCSIISILSAIAIPNFLEAQTRAKVTRMKSDIRSMAVAVEAYHVDNSKYPYRRNEGAMGTGRTDPPNNFYLPEVSTRLKRLAVLTTPQAYMSSLLTDIFDTHNPAPNNVIEYFDPTQVSWTINIANYKGATEGETSSQRVGTNSQGYLLFSLGPDTFIGAKKSRNNGWPMPADTSYTNPVMGSYYRPYDPTNGTISAGNIFYGNQLGGLDQAGAKFEDFCTPR